MFNVGEEAARRMTMGEVQQTAGEIKEDEAKQQAAEDEARIQQLRQSYSTECAASQMEGFGRAVQATVDTPPIPTGFPGLDKNLDGGLFEGLYVVGAVSSLGKTTWALQIIDQVAESGTDCLVFSLEMSQYELMAKSISRLTYQYTQQHGMGREYAKSVRGITNGRNYSRYSDRDFQVIEAAEQEYRETIGPHLWIRQGVGNIGVDEIRKGVEIHMAARDGRRPVVLVDYLQILSCYVDPLRPNRSLTDKQSVDKNILELKRISRDFKIPLIVISSFNRDSYSTPVNLSSFKESGGVEYSSDVLVGLQYTGMERQEKADGKVESDNDPARLHRIATLRKSNDEKAKRGESIEMDVKILKNRNGSRGMSDTMMYTPMFNCFRENTGGNRKVSDTDVKAIFGGKRR